jgi:transcriptional regulator with XRE-family HTH domain
MITPGQSRAARGFLNWNLKELAGRAGIAIPTISKFENGHTQPTRSTLFVLRTIFEDAGIMFIDDAEGEGVKLRRPGRT